MKSYSLRPYINKLLLQASFQPSSSSSSRVLQRNQPVRHHNQSSSLVKMSNQNNLINELHGLMTSFDVAFESFVDYKTEANKIISMAQKTIETLEAANAQQEKVLNSLKTKIAKVRLEKTRQKALKSSKHARRSLESSSDALEPPKSADP